MSIFTAMDGSADSIVEEVRADLLRRSQIGIAKYGTTLARIDAPRKDQTMPEMTVARALVRAAEALERAWSADAVLPPIELTIGEGDMLIGAVVRSLRADGFAIVPIAPTEAMLRAADREDSLNGLNWDELWRAMVTAATP